MKPPVILISAMSASHVIGTENGMPWNVPEEYQQYLRFVKGQTVIMGRKTFEIFGKDLKCGSKIVISRSLSSGDEFQVCKGVEEALGLAASYGQRIFVAGGASIYAQALPFADQMYLSIIKGEFKGIAFFPEFEQSEWKIVEEADHPRFTFFRYERENFRA